MATEWDVLKVMVLKMTKEDTLWVTTNRIDDPILGRGLSKPLIRWCKYAFGPEKTVEAIIQLDVISQKKGKTIDSHMTVNGNLVTHALMILSDSEHRHGFSFFYHVGRDEEAIDRVERELGLKGRVSREETRDLSFAI